MTFDELLVEFNRGAAGCEAQLSSAKLLQGIDPIKGGL
jgi:hypothetical protein